MSAVQGGVPLLVYTADMAWPFVALGATLSRAAPLLRWMCYHHAAVYAVPGVGLIAIGIVLCNGTLQRLNGSLRFTSGVLGGQR